MKLHVLTLLFAFVLAGLTGCSPPDPTPTAPVAAPPPQNSGADQKQGKGGRFPAPPPKR